VAHQGVDEHHRVDLVQRPHDQSFISSITVSVIRLIVSLPTEAP
jgi:hypothetical protein